MYSSTWPTQTQSEAACKHFINPLVMCAAKEAGKVIAMEHKIKGIIDIDGKSVTVHGVVDRVISSPKDKGIVLISIP